VEGHQFIRALSRELEDARAYSRVRTASRARRNVSVQLVQLRASRIAPFRARRRGAWCGIWVDVGRSASTAASTNCSPTAYSGAESRAFSRLTWGAFFSLAISPREAALRARVSTPARPAVLIPNADRPGDLHPGAAEHPGIARVACCFWSSQRAGSYNPAERTPVSGFARRPLESATRLEVTSPAEPMGTVRTNPNPAGRCAFGTSSPACSVRPGGRGEVGVTSPLRP